MKVVTLTPEQKEQLEKLWFIYGNGGQKSTKLNHSFIQGFLEMAEDRRKPYLKAPENMRETGFKEDFIKKVALTKECIDEVDKILQSQL